MRIETDAKCVVFVSKIKQDIEDIYGKSASQGRKQVYYSALLVQGQGKAAMKRVTSEIKEEPAITEIPGEEEDTDLLSAVAATKGFESVNENEYICILFDLMLYRYPELTKRVFALLVSFFTRKRTLVEGLQQQHILESSKSIQAMEKIREMHASLKVAHAELSFWLPNNKANGIEMKVKVAAIFETFTDMCIMKPKENEPTEADPNSDGEELKT